MKVHRNFYLLCTVGGTIAPWLFFLTFFSKEGLKFPFFIQSLFANGAAGGFSTEVLISILVFWVWSYTDSVKNKVRQWWLTLPPGFTVGLSLALPFYLYLRSKDGCS